MSAQTAVPRPDRAQNRAMPPAPPADYDDELTADQLAALRKFAPQNESEMGELVHEFTW